MPEFEVDRADRRRAEVVVAFVKEFLSCISVEGRFVLAIELMRLFKPEIDELKLKARMEAQIAAEKSAENP
jgi:hypothetical protein